MKEVAQDLSLRDSRGIRRTFTKETREKLCVDKDKFLLPEEESAFREMLERHGKAFTFYPNEIGCADPRIIEPIVIFTIPRVVEHEDDISPKSTYSKIIQALEGEDRDGHS